MKHSAIRDPSVFRLWCSLALCLLLAGCATAPPGNVNNACAIFTEYDDWYEDARDASRRWNVPMGVLLAIIHQESRFVADARPARRWYLGFIPGPRPSSAYGYAQALDTTWDWYKDDAGGWGADPDEFDDAVDFVGWYVDQTHRRNGVAKHDAYRNYLAYHEGHGGYARGSYAGKRWLINTARRVAARSQRYQRQLAGCREDLEDSGWWPF